jgi:PEP-CTERM putative exosortase interaction domain
MKKTIALVGMLLLLSIPSMAHAQNLLVNGGFESDGEQGHITGWTIDYNNNIFGVIDNPQSGNYNARNFWDGALRQDVAVTGGTAYQFSGWSYIPTATETIGTTWGSFFQIDWKTAAGGTAGTSWSAPNLKNLTRDQYNLTQSGAIVAPTTAAYARIKFGTWQGGDGTQYIPNPTDFDNLSFSVVPEPSSLLLLGTGIVGMLSATRKEKKHK